MINIIHYDSLTEVRLFCLKGGQTLEGSTPLVKHLPIEEPPFVYAIRRPDGLYVQEMGTNPCLAYEFHRMKWYRWFLQAEEASVGTMNKTVGSFQVMEHAIKIKDDVINSLVISLDEAHKEIVKLKSKG